MTVCTCVGGHTCVGVRPRVCVCTHLEAQACLDTANFHDIDIFKLTDWILF